MAGVCETRWNLQAVAGWLLRRRKLLRFSAEQVTSNLGLFLPLCRCYRYPLNVFVPSCHCTSQICWSLVGLNPKEVLYLGPERLWKQVFHLLSFVGEGNASRELPSFCRAVLPGVG